MLLHCHSRKCNTTREHKLKLETNEAICLDCEEANELVSDFMKTAMKTSGDLYRSLAIKKAFMYKCSKCSIDREVKIHDGKAFCRICSHPMELAEPTLKAIIASGTKDELTKGVIKRRKG